MWLKWSGRAADEYGVPRPFAALRRLLGPAVLGALLATAVLSLTGAGAASAAQPTARTGAPVTGSAQSAWARGMWVWNQPTPKSLVAFAQARGISELFVSVPNNLPTSARLTWVKSVSKLAVPAGIRLQALGGDPGWIDDPAAAVAWQNAALSTGLFSGVHVDIEPWQRGDWDTDQARVVAGYVDTYDRLRAATTLPLEADVPFWLGTLSTGDGTALDAAVLARVDKVTVMSYRDTVTGADSITDVAARTLAAGVTAGKPVRLAVETNNLGSDPVSAKQTFYGSTEAAVNAALDQVDAAESGVASYAGMAVHDYVGYDALR